MRGRSRRAGSLPARVGSHDGSGRRGMLRMTIEPRVEREPKIVEKAIEALVVSLGMTKRKTTTPET